MCSVRAATASDQYSPLRPSPTVIKKLLHYISVFNTDKAFLINFVDPNLNNRFPKTQNRWTVLWKEWDNYFFFSDRKLLFGNWSLNAGYCAINGYALDEMKKKNPLETKVRAKIVKKENGRNLKIVHPGSISSPSAWEEMRYPLGQVCRAYLLMRIFFQRVVDHIDKTWFPQSKVLKYEVSSVDSALSFSESPAPTLILI